MLSKTKKISVLDHILVPKHEVVPASEVESVLSEFGIDSVDKLPKLLANDPVAKAIGAKRGDVVRIYRQEPTGEVLYYRVVV